MMRLQASLRAELVVAPHRLHIGEESVRFGHVVIQLILESYELYSADNQITVTCRSHC